MLDLLPLRHSLPVFNAASSRAIEAAAQAALPSPSLMERAGLAVAKLALALRTQAGPIWLLCGPGNNGGDGLVAARLLHALGVPVRVSLIGATTSRPADAAQALATAQAAGVAIGTELMAEQPALVIDALLGLGLNRAPSEALQAGIDAINAACGPVLAVDLPSGLLSDTGQPSGTSAVRATHTLALLTLKPGLLTGEGRALAGRLWFDDLGVAAALTPDVWLLGADVALDLRRSASSHKGSQGSVRVVGGAPGLQGAARLAARAALASGAGRVYLDLLDSAPGAADPGWPELMHWRADAAADAVCVVGCGGGEAVAARLPERLRSAASLVLDADALNAIAADRVLGHLLRQRRAASLVTPHPLEAARLLGCETAAVQRDRLAAAHELAARLACSVVLKGSGSVIASPGQLSAINSSGSAALATAGTGDVLAGWLAGLWAQRPAVSAHAVACAGVWAHGRAGEQARPLLASELIEGLRRQA